MNSEAIAFFSLKIQVASGFWQRLIGLLGRSTLPEDEGLLIMPCNNIHTAFMRFPIDVIFVCSDGFITKVVAKLVPYRLACDFKARACIELPSGTANRLGLRVGQKLDSLTPFLVPA